MRHYENMLSLGMGAVIGVFISMIAFDSVKPVKLTTIEGYKQTIPISPMLHRIKYPGEE